VCLKFASRTTEGVKLLHNVGNCFTGGLQVDAGRLFETKLDVRLSLEHR